MTRKHWIWVGVAVAVFIVWRYKGEQIKAAFKNVGAKVAK